MKPFIFITLCLGLCFAAWNSFGQKKDTIRIPESHLITSQLKPGLRQYLVYTQDRDDKVELDISLWLRDIQTGQRNGQPVITIAQHWYGTDTSSYRVCYSVNRASDFSPIYHTETVKGKKRAFDWSANHVAGSDTVKDNVKRGFDLKLQEPNFNWNLDIETFELLPLADGKIFAINFYDAGLDPPKYIIYKVMGSEVLQLNSGKKAECWKLVTEGNTKGNHWSETYWISKKDHELIKEEDDYKHVYRYKIKLMVATPDILKRFND